VVLVEAQGAVGEEIAMSPDEELMTLILAFFNSITLLPLVALLWAVPFVVVYGIVAGLLTKRKSSLVTVIVTAMGALPAAPTTVWLATRWPVEFIMGTTADASREEVFFMRLFFLIGSIATSIVLFVAIGMIVVIAQAVADRVRERRALSQDRKSTG